MNRRTNRRRSSGTAPSSQMTRIFGIFLKYGQIFHIIYLYHSLILSKTDIWQKSRIADADTGGWAENESTRGSNTARDAGHHGGLYRPVRESACHGPLSVCFTVHVPRCRTPGKTREGIVARRELRRRWSLQFERPINTNRYIYFCWVESRISGVGRRGPDGLLRPYVRETARISPRVESHRE